MDKKEIKCWLFDPIPDVPRANNFQEFFKPNIQSARKRFDKWTKYILEDRTPLNYSNLRSIYVSSLNQYSIGYTSTYDGIVDNQRKKIVEDLTRTLQKIRHDFYPEVEPPNEKEKKLFCAVLRITLLLHLEKNLENNKFKYRQSLIELILPVYHTVWYALDNEDTYLIESVTKYLFKQFMLKTNHIQKIPGSTDFQSNLQKFEESLKKKEPEVCEFLENSNIQLMIPFKWYSLLFTHEYTFNKVIEIWDVLVEYNQSDKFNDKIITICAQILQQLSDKFKKRDKQQAIQLLQDISQIDIISIVKSRGILHHLSNLLKH